MLNECQVATDKLRNELYATFECRRKELTPLVLFDMPDLKTQTRLAKRRNSLSNELPAKKMAIALGYTPLEQEQPKEPTPTTSITVPDNKIDDDGNMFSLCRVKFDHKAKAGGKILPARCIAYSEPADVRMTIGTRLIALFKDSNKRESYYSGVVAEIPNPVNNYR
ncbi:hypothetical protein SFRURICE_002373 [Spodoptera frugiperda]|nr:hypothetical protein SFRURICE_002373 [Spodoptera frugiperda]